MKAMILAGGFGSRLVEETSVRPKPLVEIGGLPVLLHVMKTYAHYGIVEFIICLGYKGDLIRDYFLSLFHRKSDLTIDLSNNVVTVHKARAEPWKVTLVETGPTTMTGGRIKRAAQYLGSDEHFCLTYSDGLSDIDLHRLLQFHAQNGRLVTVTAVETPDRFGRIAIQDGRAVRFEEKPQAKGEWVNAGYFVVARQALDLIDGDATVWEREPLQSLVAREQLGVYRHAGFWMCMDTLQDRQTLEQLWASGKAPWNVWGDARPI